MTKFSHSIYFFLCFFILIFNQCFLCYADDSRADLSSIKSWGYWLQDINIQEIIDSPYDIIVMDYALDGTDDTAFTSGQIQQIKDSGKRVLAYFSIGEAEDYRFYWKDNYEEGSPGFIGPENPNFLGNYKVRYWKKSWWKKALKPYLKRILAAGFDGVYLDIIDGYYFWGEVQGKGIKKSSRRMIKLVRKIAKFSRKRNGNDFIICPQNGVSILDDAKEKFKTRYLDIIDCIGVEDLFYNFGTVEDMQFRLSLFSEMDQAGKKIFSVEYIKPSLYSEYFTLIDNQQINFIGYAADPDRELNELIIYDVN